MSPQTRLKLGVALLILGLIMPAGTLVVAVTDWPVAVKTVLSSILLFGFEIMIIPAVALMGKDNFDRIWAGAMRLLKTLKPAGGVSKRRYTIGLYMLVVPILYAWIASYAPSWLPEDYVLRVWVNLGLDLVALAGLFVLGGDFWDKVQALFLHDARVVSPTRAATRSKARRSDAGARAQAMPAKREGPPSAGAANQAAAAFLRLASRRASTNATVASMTELRRPFCAAIAWTSLSARSMFGTPLLSARAAEEGRVRLCAAAAYFSNGTRSSRSAPSFTQRSTTKL
jgi:hypothetical protein